MRVLCLALIIFHIGVSLGMGQKGASHQKAAQPKQKGKAKSGVGVFYLVKPGTPLASVAKFDFSGKLNHPGASAIVEKCQKKINEKFARLATMTWGQSRFGEPLVNFKVKFFAPKMLKAATPKTAKHSHVDTIIMVRPSHPASTNELYRYEYRCGMEESSARKVDWADDYFFWRAAKDKHALTRVTESELPEIWGEIKRTMNNLTKGKEYPDYTPLNAVLRGNTVKLGGNDLTHTGTGGTSMPTKKIMIISLGAGVPGLIIIVVVISLLVSRSRGPYQSLKSGRKRKGGAKNAKVPGATEKDDDPEDDDDDDEMWAPTQGANNLRGQASQRSLQNNLVQGTPYGQVSVPRPVVPAPPVIDDTYTDSEVLYDDVPRESKTADTDFNA